MLLIPACATGPCLGLLQTCGVHVWFVAHPRQLREWKGQPPNLYDISGSAHFVNKADNGIVVHRNRDPDAPNTFEVRLQGGGGRRLVANRGAAAFCLAVPSALFPTNLLGRGAVSTSAPVLADHQQSCLGVGF